MLNKKDKGILLFLVCHCKRIEEKALNMSKEDFLNNDDILDIVCFNLLQIGELSTKFSKTFIKNNSNIPWPKIKGLRNRIVHGYGSVNFETLWDTATEDIKPLREYCENILQENK